MSTAKRLHYSYEEYLRALADSEIKLEYSDGVIYAMARGTPAHALLSATAIGLLRQALLGRCAVFTSDLKIRVEVSDLSTFPDASVICGELQTSPIDANAAVNPTLLVEVTSRSTEDYDRGDKLSHYKQLASLRAVIFVSHRTRAITVVKRTGSGWSEQEFRSGEVLALEEPKFELRIDDVYAGVTLDPK